MYVGKPIWDMGLEVHKSLKKALSLLSCLAHIVTLNKTGIVVSFASGKGEQNLYDELLNGMYCLEVGEKKKTGDAPGDDGALVDSDDKMILMSTIWGVPTSH